MPGYVKTEQMDSPLAQDLDKPKWKFLMPQFSANVEAALRSQKNMEYVWDDVIDQMVEYLRSNNAMMLTEYKRIREILFIYNHQKVLVGLFIQTQFIYRIVHLSI